MSKKYEKRIERQLIDIVNSRGNDNKCGECSTAYPTWASWNIGILLCGRCASVHRRILGSDDKKISKVKSLTLEHWTDEQVENLRRIGNKRAKKKWNPKRQPFPYDDDDEMAIEEYIRDKYVLMKFRDDKDGGYDDRFSRYSDDSLTPQPTGRLRLSSVLQPLAARRLRNSSRNVPRLSHRKFTPQELGQYTFQVSKIMGLGFTNRDSVLESLILSNGNIEFALDILDQDEKINPNKTEMPPQMPRRPPAASSSAPPAPASAPPAAAAANGPDWWTNASSASQPALTGGQPQIYQYTDPLTGAISYVDANGQQYLDPNNPQHQQAIQQQTNPQLIAQQTNKQNILSLYNKPDQFVTNVAAKVDPLALTPGQQLQTQQTQLQQTQLQQPQFTGFQPQVTGFQPQAAGYVSPYAQTPAPAFGQQYTFQQQPQQAQQQQQFGQYGYQQQHWG